MITLLKQLKMTFPPSVFTFFLIFYLVLTYNISDIQHTYLLDIYITYEMITLIKLVPTWQHTLQYYNYYNIIDCISYEVPYIPETTFYNCQLFMLFILFF